MLKKCFNFFFQATQFKLFYFYVANQTNTHDSSELIIDLFTDLLT
jgi:hypothetical protein